MVKLSIYLKICSLGLLLLSFVSDSKGQDTIFVNKEFFGLPDYQIESKEIDKISQLPENINKIIDQIFEYSLTDFKNNISFRKGQILELEELNIDTSSILRDYLIPKYELFFDLSDTTIGIKNYSFQISLDEYGQLIYMDWPRELYNKRDRFYKTSEIVNTALKYAKKEKLNAKDFTFALNYNNEAKKIYWQFHFLIFSRKEDNGSFYRKYKSIAIDPLSLKIDKIFNMRSVGIAD